MSREACAERPGAAPPPSLAVSDDADSRLRELEATARFLLASHPCPAWVYDPAAQRFLEVNEAATARYGYSRQEFLECRLADIRLAGRAGEAWPTAPGDGQSWQWTREEDHRLRDGQVVAVSVTGRYVRWGSAEAILVVAQDPLHLGRAEQGLRRSQEEYRTVVDNVRQVIFQTDARGRWTFLNPAWTEITGFTIDESLGTPFLRYVHPEDRQRHAELFQPLMQHREEYFGLEARYLTKAGGVRWVDVYARLTLDEHGLVSGTFGTLMDITERRRAEEAADAARARLRDVLASTPAMIYSAEATGDYAVTFVSENLTRQFGYDVHEVLADPRFWATHIHPDDAAEVRRQVPRVLDESRQTLTYRFRHKDGAYRWVDDERRLIRDEAGQPVEIVGSWIDVTERRQAEESKAELESQLRQSQKLEAIGRLAGGVAHDFNNLLTVITGRSELVLRRLEGGGPLSRDLELIVKTAERAAALTRQLLAFSRKQVLAPRVLDLNAVLTNMEKLLRRLIGEDIELVTVQGESLGRIQADPGQIEQVIMNLAVNARDAMPKGGKLVVETANLRLGEASDRRCPGLRPGAWVQLSVTDTGCGMDSDTLSHIFEPFFTTKGPEAGTGLGLSTVYGIVKQSEGEIGVESEPGRGTTFRIYFPRVDGPVAAPVAGAARAALPRGSETVLLTEDDDSVRRLAREVLRLSGYTVFEAANGDEALDLAARHPDRIHLLVTDVIMPQMGGFEVAQRLRQARPEIKVLYLSGYTEEALGRHGVRATEDWLLLKPFTPSHLARTVRDVLDGRRRRPDDAS